MQAPHHQFMHVTHKLFLALKFCIDNVCAGHVHTYVVHIHIFVRNVILLTTIHFFSLVIDVFGGTFMHYLHPYIVCE